MTKYEYKCAFIMGGVRATILELNEYGKEGWELVCSEWCWHYLKRPLEE